MSHELQLPIVPDFQIEGNWYILLVFSIREDYALATISKIIEKNEGFESNDSQEFLDLEENFDARECLVLCFNNAKEYRETGNNLSDKYFIEFQRQCGYDKLQVSTKDFTERDTIEGRSTVEGSDTVDLYRLDTFLHDETEEVRFFDELRAMYFIFKEFLINN